MTIFLGVNLATSWSAAWTKIVAATGFASFTTLMGIIGALLVVVGVVGYIWERRRGGGGSHSKLIYTIVIGGILAAPDVVIPSLLTIVDFIVNAIVGLIG